MLKNYRLEVQYDGTDYRGLQRQTNWLDTIQGHLEAIAAKIFESEIRVVVAGRTDAGVHATGQIVNFLVDSRIPVAKVRILFNKYLNKDIYVSKIDEVPISFHARKNVVSRTYKYYMYTGDSVFPGVSRYALQVNDKFDIVLAQSAANIIRLTTDFASCMTSGSYAVTTIKRIFRCSINEVRTGFMSPGIKNMYCFLIEADSFLYNMVRILVANLISVAIGKISASEFELILASGDRKYAGVMSPPNGLYLTNVRYE